MTAEIPRTQPAICKRPMSQQADGAGAPMCRSCDADLIYFTPDASIGYEEGWYCNTTGCDREDLRCIEVSGDYALTRDEYENECERRGVRQHTIDMEAGWDCRR